MAEWTSNDAYTPITLDDLAVRPVVIRLHTAAGRTLQVRLTPLTCAQWAEIGAEVENPREPPQRTPATLQVYNAHVEKAEEERNYRRVAFALELGGNPIPGVLLGEKAASLRRMDRGLVASVYRFLREAAEGDEARIVQSADTFQPGSGGHPADLRT